MQATTATKKLIKIFGEVITPDNINLNNDVGALIVRTYYNTDYSDIYNNGGLLGKGQ